MIRVFIKGVLVTVGRSWFLIPDHCCRIIIEEPMNRILFWFNQLGRVLLNIFSSFNTCFTAVAFDVLHTRKAISCDSLMTGAVSVMQ